MIYIKPITCILSPVDKMETLMYGGILQDVDSKQIYKFQDERIMYANVSTKGEILEFQDSTLFLDAFIHRNFKEVEIIEKQWYDDLDDYPIGILCYCSVDKRSDIHFVKIVKFYSYIEKLFYTSDNSKFSWAEPIPKEVINSMTYES